MWSCIPSVVLLFFNRCLYRRERQKATISSLEAEVNQKLAELMRVCANRSHVCPLLILPQGAPRSVLLLLPIILFLSLCNPDGLCWCCCLCCCLYRRERQKATISSLEAEVNQKLAELQLLSEENEMLKLRSAVLEAVTSGREYHVSVDCVIISSGHVISCGQASCSARTFYHPCQCVMSSCCVMSSLGLSEAVTNCRGDYVSGMFCS
jgi:hypothetical protein